VKHWGEQDVAAAVAAIRSTEILTDDERSKLIGQLPQ